MVHCKQFRSLQALNDFIDNNKVKIISINEITVTTPSDFPPIYGIALDFDEQRLNLYYQNELHQA